MAALPVSSALPDRAEAGKVRPNAIDDVMARFPDEEMIDFIIIGSERMFGHFCRRWLRVLISLAELKTGNRDLAVDIAKRALICLWETAPADAYVYHSADIWLLRLVDQAAAGPAGPVPPPQADEDPETLISQLAAIARTRPQQPPRGWGWRMLRRLGRKLVPITAG